MMKELKLIGNDMSLDVISEYLSKLEHRKIEDGINKGLLLLNAQEQFENDGDFRQWVRKIYGEQGGESKVDRYMKFAQMSVGMICTDHMTFSELQELLSRKCDIAANDP